MSKASFHSCEEEEENDYVYTTPPHPQTSASVLYEQEDHPTTIAPMERPQQIRKQSQFLQTPYKNLDPVHGHPGMPLLFDPMSVVDH